MFERGASHSAPEGAGRPRDDGVGVAVDPVADVSAAVERLRRAAARAAGWTSTRRTAVLDELGRIEGALRVARSAVLAAERDAGTSVRPGDRSFEDARARQAGFGLVEARREARQGAVLEAMPLVADGVAGGAVSLPHLDVLASVAAAGSDEQRAALADPATQAGIVRVAATQTPANLRRRIEELFAAHDPARLQDHHERARRNRFLHLSTTTDGTRLSGLLDPSTGHVLQLALEAATRRPEGDEREPEQIRADALATLAEHALGCGSDDAAITGSRNRPHLSLIVPAETMVELHAHARTSAAEREAVGRCVDDPRRVAGQVDRPDHVAGQIDRPDDIAGDTQNRAPTVHGVRDDTGSDGRSDAGWLAGRLDRVPPVVREDGAPVPLSVLAKALCDCDITRIAITSEGVPVDLGRTQRLYSGAHRRAVIVRDQGCAWNGCDTPARFGEVHHIRWWQRDDGETSLSNAVLLCDFHHHRVHELDLTIERHPAVPPPRGAVHVERSDPGPGLFVASGTRDDAEAVSDVAPGADALSRAPSGAADPVRQGSRPRATYTFRRARDGVVVSEPRRHEPHAPRASGGTGNAPIAAA
ncbi:HNH endonuclease signature motif containing protein [Cellulomonas sp. HZM]|uniref:HNH endonuclease signature motif containing protein n=1 Tax=Cellulomonas sp. HZM TaxID=1454010 RepID=UPI00049395FA|nr:HNH endonuclease signature motif containing protein [Cellulomonas sp. HZM]